MTLDKRTRRIQVEACPYRRVWLWQLGIPNAKDQGFTNVLGAGEAFTRWGAVHKARRQIRSQRRQARRREKALVIDVESER